MFKKGMTLLLILMTFLVLMSCKKTVKTEEQVSDFTSDPDIIEMFEKTYSNMKNQFNFQFNININWNYENHSINSFEGRYHLDMKSKNDGLIYASINSTDVFLNLVDRVYYRVYPDKTLSFYHKKNTNNSEYMREEISTKSLMSLENNVISTLFSHNYYSALTNIKSYQFINKVQLEQVEYSVYEVEKDYYYIMGHPLVKEILYSIDTNNSYINSGYFKNFKYKLYIDETNHVLRKIEVDLSPNFNLIKEVRNMLDTEVPQSFIFTYDFKNINKTKVTLPKELNFFDEADTEIRDNFLNLWDTSVDKIMNASSLTVTENMQFIYYNPNSQLLKMNIKNDIVKDPLVIKTTTNYDSESYLKEENDKLFTYRSDGNQLIKTETSSYSNDIISDYIIPINEENVRLEDEYTQNKIRYQAYKYELTYEEFNNYFHLFDYYFKPFNSLVNKDFSQLKAYVILTFDVTNMNLKTIEIDLEEYLERLFGFFVGQCHISLEFSNFNTVSIDYSQIESTITDDAVDKISKGLMYQAVPINEEHVGKFEITEDVDVYKINIHQDGKYLFNMSETNHFKTSLYDEQGRFLNNTSGNNFSNVLDVGTYYIIFTNFSDKTLEYHFNYKLVQDDYSNYIIDEGIYKVGTIMGQQQITGQLNYTSDYDVIKLPSKAHVNIKLTSEADIVVSVFEDDLLTTLVDGESYTIMINSLTYLMIYSPTNQLGNYTIDYSYDLKDDSTQIQLGDKINGLINYPEDRDTYLLELFDFTKIQIPLEGDLNVKLSIERYHSIKHTISKEILKDSPFYSLELEPGLYKIIIEDFNQKNVGSYGFSFIENQDDDYADFSKEQSYTRLLIDKPGIYSINSNFLGDKEVFDFKIASDGFYSIKLKGSNDLFLKYCHDSDREVYCQTVDKFQNENIYYINTDKNDINELNPSYYIVTSNTFVGEYQIEVEKYDESLDYPNHVESKDIPYVNIESPIDLLYHSKDDVDFFKISINEKRIYNFYFHEDINNPIDSLNIPINIYDSNKNLIYDSRNEVHSIILEPGDYYILIDYYSISTIKLFIDKVIDDYEDVNLISLTNDVIGYINYVNDTDQFKFIIDKNRSLTLTVSVNDSIRNCDCTFKVKNENGDVLDEETISYSYKYMHIYLSPGNYYIEVSGHYNGEPYKIQFK